MPKQTFVINKIENSQPQVDKPISFPKMKELYLDLLTTTNFNDVDNKRKKSERSDRSDRSQKSDRNNRKDRSERSDRSYDSRSSYSDRSRSSYSSR